jgi:hypothetical protein
MRTPDLGAQRAAMKKLSFLVGKWSGSARILRGSAEPLELNQTEEAQYWMDGLILMIEGVGHSKADGTIALHALGVVSYDDEAQEYRMRAFNLGRWLETELRLAEADQRITWGFALGDVRTDSVLQINEAGEWTELTEMTVGSEPPRKFMQLNVGRQA